MSFEYCENLKKIELHAHLNGSLSVKTIGRLGMYVFYNILFYGLLSFIFYVEYYFPITSE